jgi:two-component system, NarL family, nitrate/nitrite response regulator NarL
MNKIVKTFPEDGRLYELVRSVIKAKGAEEAPAEYLVGGSSKQIVFDIDVDGDRYILTRTAQAEDTGFSLSPREREIVRMVARGHQSKVIAAVLNISSWTVCTHMRRIFAKLGVSSRAAMVAKVADLGIFGMSEALDAPVIPQRPCVSKRLSL